MPLIHGSDADDVLRAVRVDDNGCLLVKGLLDLLVENQNATKSYPDTRILRIDESDGFSLSQPDTYTVRIDLSGIPKTINVDNGIVVVSNTTTPTTIYNVTIPGGTLGTQHALKLYITGSASNQSGGDSTLNIAITYGGAGITDMLCTMINGTGLRSFEINATISANASVSAQVITANVLAIANVATRAATTSIDSNVDQTLLVVATLGAAASTLYIGKTSAHITLYKHG